MAGRDNMKKPLRCITTSVCVLGEGPYWQIDAQRLWWVDIVGRKLLSWSQQEGERCYDAPCMLSSVLQVDQFGVLLASEKGLMRFHLGDFSLCRAINTISADQRSNESQIDPYGRILLSSLDKAVRADNGQLILLEGHDERVILSAIGIANTMVWSADGKRLYFADSRRKQMWLYDYCETSPILRNGRLFFSTEGTAAVPDGSAIDVEECLWTALWDGGSVVRVTPTGDIDRVISLPVSRPTSCVFGGDNLTTLFITTASKDLSDTQRSQQIDAGKVFAIDVGVAGKSPYCTSKF